MGRDHIALPTVDQWSHGGSGVEARAHPRPGRPRRRSPSPLIRARRSARPTCRSVPHSRTPPGGLGVGPGRIEPGVDDQRILAAEFEERVGTPPGADLGDSRPVGTEPTWQTRSTSGWVTRGRPTRASPWITFRTPGGSSLARVSASNAASNAPESGVRSDGEKTTGLPHNEVGGNQLCGDRDRVVPRCEHGGHPARFVHHQVGGTPGALGLRPRCSGPSSAYCSITPMPASTPPRDCPIGFPPSRACNSANSASRSPIRPAAALSRAARSAGAVAPSRRRP